MSETGVYFSYGDLRLAALKMAIDSADDLATAAVVERAWAFFDFLASGGNLGNPPSKI